ncbi:MAG: restriction endonuclease, partial [Methylococcales bacterium]|nr:restriction endonuclease [Methylococcales bacterium]
VQIYEPEEGDSPVPPNEPDDTPPTEDETPDYPTGDGGKPDVDIDDGETPIKKYYVNQVPVTIVNERVQYYGKDGKLITESLKDYSKKNIIREFSSLNGFKEKWNNTSKKEDLLKELAEHGVLIEALREEIGQDLDAFDLICHVAFDQPPLTRKERANNVRKRNYFAKYSEKAQKVLNSLLDKYENEGVVSIESSSVLKVQPLNKMGSPVELVRAFGKKKDFDKAILDLENELYNIA